MNKKWNPRLFRFGTFTVILTAFVVGIIVLVNVLFSKMPSKVREIDLSENQRTEISEETKKLLNSLTEDVTITVMQPEGSEPSGDALTVMTLLNRYADASDHIKMDTIDPNNTPNLREKYEITGTLYYYSLIVKTATRYRYVPFSTYAPQKGIFVTYTDYETMGADGEPETYDRFEAEKSITSAIDYVTKDILPTMYCLTGHGEYSLSDYLTPEIDAKNIAVVDLDLHATGAVPEDCSALFINAPDKDLTDDEMKSILDYIEKGGKIFYVTRPLEEKLQNFGKLTDFFTLDSDEGIVIEGDASYYDSYYGPILLMPELVSHEITNPLMQSGYRIYAPYALSLYSTGTDESITVTPLAKSSKASFRKALDANTIEKEAGDETGSFLLALLAEKTDGNKPAMVWFSAADMTSFSDANITMTVNALNYLIGETDNISISTQAVDQSYLVMDSKQGTLWTIVFAVLTPLAIIGLGIFVVVRRRSK